MPVVVKDHRRSPLPARGGSHRPIPAASSPQTLVPSPLTAPATRPLRPVPAGKTGLLCLTRTTRPIALPAPDAVSAEVRAAPRPSFEHCGDARLAPSNDRAVPAGADPAMDAGGPGGSEMFSIAMNVNATFR